MLYLSVCIICLLGNSSPVTSSIQQNSILDRNLKSDLANKISSDNKYKSMMEFRKKLPSYSMREVRRILIIETNTRELHYCIQIESANSICFLIILINPFTMDKIVLCGRRLNITVHLVIFL